MKVDLILFLAVVLLSLSSIITSFTLYKLGKRLSDLEEKVFNVFYSDPRIDQRFG